MNCNETIDSQWLCEYPLNMTTKTNPRKDFTQVAFDVFQRAIGEAAPKEEPTKAQKDGRKGGLTGGKSRAVKLTAEQRSDIARKAAQSRWKK